MLTVESFGPGGRDAVSYQATRVVIKDASGNPLVAAVLYDADQYLVVTCEDETFDAVLRTMGMTAARVSRRLDIDS